MSTPTNNQEVVATPSTTKRVRKPKEAAKATVYAKIFSEVADIDTKDAKIERGLRQAKHAIQAQIHLLQGEGMQLENVLDTAVMNKKVALINNGRDIDDTKRYVDGLIIANNRVVEAEEAIDKLEAKISYLEGLLKEITSEETI